MKKIAIIPTLFTLGNAICGFAAIAYASKIDPADPGTELYFAVSGWLIIAAMLCDALDGYVARLAKSSSKFGGELDSLCDGISFGAAPAFLLMRMGPGWERPFLHQLLAGVAALFMICALLRLARYNVESTADANSQKRFRGLPSPGAAGCLAALAILRGAMADGRWLFLDGALVRGSLEVWATLGSLAVALLMVSRVPYPHVTKQFLQSFGHGHRHFSQLVQLILIVFFVVLTRELALLIGFWLYALGVPARYLALRSLRRQALTPAPSTVDDGPPR